MYSYAQSSHPAFSIEKKQRLITFGWELGLNKTYIKETDFRFGQVSGHKGGVYANLRFKKQWALENSLTYERKGAYSEGLEVLYRFKYLTLSSTPSYGNEWLQVAAGPYFSYLIQATDDIPDNHIVLGAMTADQVGHLDFGIKLGASVFFLKRVGISFNYDHGITSIHDEPILGASGHPSHEYWRNRNRAFSISLKMNVKKRWL